VVGWFLGYVRFGSVSWPPPITLSFAGCEFFQERNSDKWSIGCQIPNFWIGHQRFKRANVGRGSTQFSRCLKVQAKCVASILDGFFKRITRAKATRDVWKLKSIGASRVFVDDGKIGSHHLLFGSRPAIP